MSDQLNFKQVPFDTMYYNNLSKKGGQVLIECDPNRTVLKIIETCITKNNTVLSDAELAQWILRYHVQRTKNHVENVKLCANYLREFFQFGGYFDRFIAKVQQHDYDKLQGNEHVASFALNAPLYKYKDLYEISPEAKRVYEEIEWPKHHQLNDHHPENYMHRPDPEKEQWVITDEELEDAYKDKGGHPAILMALGEMVADWAAVGIEMGDTAKDWWLKNKDKRWSYGPRYTQALEACLEWIPSKLYVQSSEPIPEPPKLKMNVTSNISEERISQAVVNNIKDGLVYHASPIKLAFLAGKHTGNWSGEQGNVFVTPVKGLAACFVINKNDVVDKAEQQLGGRLIGLNFGYDIWNKPIDKLRALPREIVVTLNVRGLKPFTGESTGYLYTIDYTKYADKTHMFHKNPNSDVEFLIEGDVHYKSCEKITIKWKCVSSEDDIKRHGEAKVDSDPSLESVYNVSTTLSSVSDEGLFDPVVEEGMYYTIRNFPVVQFFNKLRKEYKTTKLEHLFKVIGIRFFFAQKRTINIHKFFIPELIYLLDKFRFPVSLIDTIKSHTWVGDVVQPTEFADLTVLNKEINAKFYEHQIEFIKNYVSNKTMNHLRGYLLSFEQGLGKTITALGLMTALKKEHVVIICPKNTMLETWNAHLIKFFNQKQKVWVAGYTKGPLTTSYRWIIVNYERIDEVKEFLVKNKLNNLGVIVDESHNFLRTSSLRTQLLLDLARYNQNADLLLLSGTPIKCAGVELIPIMSVLDPYFDEEACTIFKATFGFNTAIANDVLNARLTRMITRVTKDILSLPEKKETTVSVHMPTGWKYTVSQVEKQIVTFVKERQDYYQQNLTTYITAFEEAIKWLQNEPGIGDQPEFQRYMDTIDELKNSNIVDARGNADIVWANQYERDVLIPALPDDLRKKFIWSKSVVKYLPLKIKGEVIGTLLTHLRMQMTTEMLQAADIKQYVDKAMKKTVVFTSYVDTIEVAYNYFQSNGYNVAAVYGKTASELTATVKRFQEDQSVNPLIASLKMISTGATLTAANTVIFLNKPWRSIEYQQASDRVHRIGQDTDCEIISLVLDTGKEANLSTRMEDIMQWSSDQFDQIVDKKEREMMRKFFRGFESLDIPEDCNEFNDSFSENMNCDVVSNELFSFFGNNGSTPISIKSLDKMKLQTLSKHSDLIEALDQWILVPDKRLLPKLIELGKIVDSIYSIKEMTVYRGIDVGFMYKGKIQDTMGLTEGFFNTLKDGVGIGYTFKYGITKPLSTTTDVKIASAFGSVIVEGSIPRFVSKLVITDELSYLVCKRRNIEPSTQKECIIFPGSHIAFKVISTGSQEVFNASLEQYDPPYNEEQMREHGYAEEVIERLKRDPAHSWRMKTGIELIHIELTRTELKRIWKNWQQMTPDQKRISDRKCRELFGCDNKTLYEYLIPQYKVESPDKGVVKYPPKSDGSSSESISADTKTKIKEITFPSEEIDTLKKQNRIVTTRVSADYNKFFVDDLVQTPWGDIFKVTKREEISDVKDHPYFNELTEGQKKFLSKYDKIAVLTLMKTKVQDALSLEQLDSSMEASTTPSKIAQKKKKILDYICKLCDTMEPSGLNSKRYRRIIGQMNDKEFDQFMNYMKEGKWQLHLVAPNMIVNLQNEDLLKACDLIGLDLFQRVWMYDRATGRKYLTDNKYMFVKLPIRRQQQFLDEKISVPDNDRTIDGLTGQVTGDSRSCSITNPEIQILAARGLDKTMQELVNIRGGNIHGYSEFRRMLEENGEADLDMIDPNSRTRASVVGSKLLQSMMLDTNL